MKKMTKLNMQIKMMNKPSDAKPISVVNYVQQSLHPHPLHRLLNHDGGESSSFLACSACSPAPAASSPSAACFGAWSLASVVPVPFLLLLQPILPSLSVDFLVLFQTETTASSSFFSAFKETQTAATQTIIINSTQ